MASSITGIKLRLEDVSNDENNIELKPLVLQLQALHDETRRMSHNLMPLGLNEENWVERIDQYCRENSIPSFKIMFNNNVPVPFSMPTSDSILLYRSMQELIHNAQKHSKSDICHVQISLLPEELILTIEDEGIGFKENSGDSQGLKSIRKRLSEIDATLDIDSRENGGTLISISLPF
jgi:signal transduction histidine kinase